MLQQIIQQRMRKKRQLKKSISWIPQCEVAKHHGGSNLYEDVTNRKDGSKTPKLRENLEQENAKYLNPST